MQITIHLNAITFPIWCYFFRAFELEIERLESPDCYFCSISVDLQKKRDFIAKILKDAGMDPVIPEGGYFIMANWSQLGKDALNQMPFLQEIITNQKSCKVFFFYFQF